jgi:DNA-binding transcriptional ArsR family regulator
LELFVERARTTKQAAQAMGEAPTRLYHHVAALERAGLVRLRETRRVRGATEKYFEAVTSGTGALRSPGRPGQGGGRAHATLGVMLFEQARNELVRALTRRSGRKASDVMAVRGVLRLTPAQVARLRAELTRLLRQLREPAQGGAPSARGARRRYSLTIALMPAEAESE